MLFRQIPVPLELGLNCVGKYHLPNGSILHVETHVYHVQLWTKIGYQMPEEATEIGWGSY